MQGAKWQMRCEVCVEEGRGWKSARVGIMGSAGCAQRW